MDQITSVNTLSTRAFWRAVGSILKTQREKRKWNLVDVQYKGGPNYSTVEEHEQGNVRTVSKLELHLQIFGLDMVNVFHHVLITNVGNADVRDVQIQIQAQNLAGKYLRTTDRGRDALDAMAQALQYAEPPTAREVVREVPQTISVSPVAGRAAAESKPKPASRVRNRRARKHVA